MYVIILIIWKGVDIMTNKMKKILTLLLALSVILVMIFSSVYLILESDHDCLTQHCEICSKIAIAQSNFGQFSFFVAAASLLLFSCSFIIFGKRSLSNRLFHITLVNLKVKLSN